MSSVARSTSTVPGTDIAPWPVGPRRAVGQAKGILRERFPVDDEAAFRMLVRSSQDTTMTLTAVAHWLTDEAGAARARPGDAADLA